MKIYAVGGAVRDRLLGLPTQDRDWVVVGATPEAMLQAGFRPVGRDFPVFLHPKTQEEYALARTERKTGRGYVGFSFHAAPEVSLEEDLRRRDLTINAMAMDDDGHIVDPWGGRADLAQRILRHVSPAFAEDPVRILRIARFAARFHDFDIAPETLELMRAMVAQGEVDALVAERVWQELARGLMEARPSRMFDVLRACGALQKLLPELDALWGVPQPPAHHPEIDVGVHTLMVADLSAQLDAPLPVRFAALMHDLGKGCTPAELLPRHHGHEEKSAELLEGLYARLRIPSDCRDLARLVARHHGNIHRYDKLRHATRLNLLESCDALRRPARFDGVLLACEADYRGRLGYADRPYPQAAAWRAALAAVRAVDAGAIARATNPPSNIPRALHEARVAALRASVKMDRDETL